MFLHHGFWNYAIFVKINTYMHFLRKWKEKILIHICVMFSIHKACRLIDTLKWNIKNMSS